MVVRGGSVAGYRPPPVPVAPYAGGPGDVVSGASAWWGLRAYTSASIGTNAIRLRRDSDSAEQDFTTIAGGGIDLTGISSFKGAANLFITKLYDQTGNGFDLAQATAARQPAFTLSGLGTLPIMTFSSHCLISIINPNVAQPISICGAAINTAAASADDRWFTARSGSFVFGFNNSAANQYLQYAGAGMLATGSQTDAVWHRISAVYNAGSSNVDVDGTTTNTTISTNGTDSAVPYILGANDTSVSQPFIGSSVEVGAWPVAFTAGNQSSLDANLSAYWGI